MKHLRTMPRRFKNGIRSGTVPKAKTRATAA
jgi:hypothetical protein